MQKRGVAILFHWILISIVGALVLIFFVGFAFKALQTSDTSTSASVATTLEQTLETLRTTTSSTKTFTSLAEQSLLFSCDSFLGRHINVDEISRKTSKLIVAPTSFQDDVILWAKAWEFPFFVDTLYFAADKDLFLFIYNNPTLAATFPSQFQVFALEDITLVRQLAEQGKKVRVLAYDQAPVGLPASIPVFVISGNQVTFYPEGKTTPFLGPTLGLGAVFSKDFLTYTCILEAAKKRLTVVSTLYQKKAELLARKQPLCKNLYTEMSFTLEKLPTNPSLVDTLTTLEDKLERNGCAPLY